MKSDTAPSEDRMYLKQFINICFKTYIIMKFLSPGLLKIV